MKSINEVILLGRVGKDPVISKFANGTEYAKFSLATSEKRFDKAEEKWKENTEWHNISVTSSYCVNVVKDSVKKGSLVYLRGQINNTSYQDKNTGEKKSFFSIVVKDFNAMLINLDNEKKQNKSEYEYNEYPYSESNNRADKKDKSNNKNGEIYFDDFIDDEIPF